MAAKFVRSIPVSYRSRDEIPEGARRVAQARMADFVRMFGYVMSCGAAMDLHRFAVSCYLQGCEDMAQAAANEVITNGKTG